MATISIMELDNMILYGLDNRERIKRMKWESFIALGLVSMIMRVDGETFRAEASSSRVSKRKFKQIIRELKCMY